MPQNLLSRLSDIVNVYCSLESIYSYVVNTPRTSSRRMSDAWQNRKIGFDNLDHFLRGACVSLWAIQVVKEYRLR